MSRLIIKNLPKKVTEDKIKQLFSQKGTVTDIQLKYTPDGKFRQFGFIGYQNEEQAQAALEYFNGTCISTNKITVELCANLGDSNKPRAWSKFSVENDKKNIVVKDSQNSNKNLKTKNTENIIDEKFDEDFEEFKALKLKQGAIWSNDGGLNVDSNVTKDHETEENSSEDDDQEEEEEEEETSTKVANTEISDLEYMKSLMVTKPRQKTEKAPKVKLDLFTIKIRGLPYTCKKKDIKHFFQPLVPFSIRVPRNVKGFAYVGFKTEKDFKKALNRNKSFLAGKQIFLTKYIKNDTNESDINKNKFKNTPWKDKEELLKNEEDIATSGKIFIRNLTYTVTEDEIQKLFEKYGPITEVNLPVDKNTRQIKGFGTVTFVFPEHAAKAYCELDGSVFCGRMLHLLPTKTSDSEKLLDEDSLDFKKKKELKQKSEANSSHNWNSLFIGADAVANVVAETYGTTKEHVLGTEVNDNKNSTSAAVRLALGETQIVQNIKKFLVSHDIYLDAFETQNIQRSKITILVKNLPAETRSDEIRQLFQRFGPISRLVLPPNGITAVVEFYEPSEARAAFSKLAYTKFKNKPLYLEWAPQNIFKTSKGKNNDKNETDKNLINKETLKDNTEEQNVSVQCNEIANNNKEEVKEQEESEPEPNTVLFVKNLNFSTTDTELRKHFEQCGKLSYANVATKTNSKQPDQKLSMGYGFVRYMLQSDAEKALKTLQFSELAGKSLELKRSSRTTQADQIKSNKKSTIKNKEQNGTKILIRNIPFQANKNEIRDLFAPFGEIKALRLPQKLSGESHRGFAFVDFHTKSDAKRAFESLSQSTHLYGRRLVLEWAENEADSIDVLRKRTADKLNVSQFNKFKKSRLDLDE